jgi:two-component system sensor histidine kinase BaeS
MRSLTLKLTLAFLFVSVIGVVITAVVVRQRTQREFDRFVLDRYQLDLLDALSKYYEQTGGWEGLNAIIIRNPYYRPGRGPEAVPAPVTLTDMDGQVIYGGRLYQVGEQVTQAELKKAVAVEVNEEPVGWLLFTDRGPDNLPGPESPESRFLANMNQAILFGALGAVLVALLLGLLLARTISRPVREVTAATQLVAGGDLGYQVPVRTKDELGDLANSFNRMSTDLAQANELRRQMTADIAHDLRTPLSVILGYMESLNSGKLQPTPETFSVMYAKAQHLQHLIDDLRTLALADAGELSLTRRPVNAAILLEHTALAHMVQAQEKGVEIRVEASQELPPINVDQERMIQVLGNLVSNALRYTPEGGEILLAAEQRETDILLKVQDSGPGIASEDISHIFERFYRSDKSRPQNGESGLGLAIAKSIVDAHGGTIRAESTAQKGAKFIITFPSDQSVTT